VPKVGAAAFYTLEQLQEHNSSSDCWLAVHGRVVAVDDGGSAHMGGNFFDIGSCGKDVTENFDRHHSMRMLELIGHIGGSELGTLHHSTYRSSTIFP